MKTVSRQSIARSTRHHRYGFSLAELVVSIGILVLMMALVSQVFKLTVDSTSQANAVIEINQSIRLLEEELREDLRGIDPSRSMMVIVGNPIDAYWTRDLAEADPDGDPTNGYPHPLDIDRERYNVPVGTVIGGINGAVTPPHALYPPRADTLMFFTSRPATSTLDPSIRSTSVQVVYGHANIGELDSAGNFTPSSDPFPAPVLPATVPITEPTFVNLKTSADQWHLARRTTLIVDAPADDIIQAIDPGVSGLVFDTLPSSPDDTLDEDFGQLASDGSDDEFNGLIEGKFDIISNGGPFLNNIETQDPRMYLTTFQPSYFNELAMWYRRSEFDVTPPPSYTTRLGHYFLPRCASFKVEWGFVANPPAPNGIVWVDPARIVNSVVNQLPVGHPQRAAFEPSMGGRFDPTETVANEGINNDYCLGSTHTFFARKFFPDSVGPADLNAPDPWFPTALRITIDVFDRTGTLVRPVRHVMVLPIGSTM